jgi:hypothetical protein
MQPCPQCHGQRIVNGKLVEYGKRNSAVFRPDALQGLVLTFAGGTDLDKHCFACRDCGMVWTFTDKDKLNRFLERHCDGLKDMPNA